MVTKTVTETFLRDSAGLAAAVVSGDAKVSSLRQMALTYAPTATGQALRGLIMTAMSIARNTIPLPPGPFDIPSDPEGASSGKKTVRKTGRREDVMASGLEIVERPLRLAKAKKGLKVSSVWSSLRDMVSGKRVLRNTFSFKMSSVTDKRGLMAIPLRHEADMAMDYTGYAVGSQTSVDVPSATFPAYSTMMKEPAQCVYGAAVPAHDACNVIVPRLNLPALEQTSWDLNCLKLIPTDRLMDRLEKGGSNTPGSLVTAVQQLGGSAIPWAANATIPNSYENGLPAARDSYARRQEVKVSSDMPYEGFSTIMPQFKTQLGGGNLKMRMCNQGTNQATVEFVVVKVVNPFVAKFNASSGVPDLQGGHRTNMSRAWSLLHYTVGAEYERKVRANPSYAMGSATPSTVELKNDVLSNPYKEFLPSSCFKTKFPLADNVPLIDNNQLGGGVSKQKSNLYGYNFDAYLQNPQNPSDGAPAGVVGPYGSAGGVGQHTPYRVVNRGHCTIRGAGERTVTIPIPGAKYNASRIKSTATSWGLDPTTNKNELIDSLAPCCVSDESYIVFVSVNGSMQDVIETAIGDASTVKVIGKAYTASTVDFHCQYSETVYPSHCDYAAMTPEKFNLGVVRGPQVVGSTTAYPGKIMPMANAIPVVQNGVVRTGANDRGSQN